MSPLTLRLLFLSCATALLCGCADKAAVAPAASAPVAVAPVAVAPVAVAPVAGVPSGAAATPDPSAPAAAAADTAKAKTVSLDETDRHLRLQGYTPQMRDGQKVYCRREETLGSRVGGKTVCSTPEQIKAAADEAQASSDYLRRMSGTGCSNPCK